MTVVPQDIIGELEARIVGSPGVKSREAAQHIIWALRQSEGLTRDVAVVYGHKRPKTVAQDAAYGIHDIYSHLLPTRLGDFFNHHNLPRRLSSGCSESFNGWALFVFPEVSGQAAITNRIRPDLEAIRAIELPEPIYPDV